MANKLRVLLALTMVFTGACTIKNDNSVAINGAGGPTGPSGPTTVAVSGLGITPLGNILLSIGQSCTNTSQQLVVTISPANATNQAFVYSTTNHGAVTVSSTGLVSAVRVGTDTVTATSVADSTKKASVVVTVSNTTCVVTPPVNNDTTIVISPGGDGSGASGTTAQLIAIVTGPAGMDKSVLWYSTDPDVVAVAQKDGDNITLKGVVILANVKGGTIYHNNPGTAYVCVQLRLVPRIKTCVKRTVY